MIPFWLLWGKIECVQCVFCSVEKRQSTLRRAYCLNKHTVTGRLQIDKEPNCLGSFFLDHLDRIESSFISFCPKKPSPFFNKTIWLLFFLWNWLTLWTQIWVQADPIISVFEPFVKTEYIHKEITIFTQDKNIFHSGPFWVKIH